MGWKTAFLPGELHYSYLNYTAVTLRCCLLQSFLGTEQGRQGWAGDCRDLFPEKGQNIRHQRRAEPSCSFPLRELQFYTQHTEAT